MKRLLSAAPTAGGAPVAAAAPAAPAAVAEEASESAPLNAKDLKRLKNDELRALLKARGLETKGKKADLVKRLLA